MKRVAAVFLMIVVAQKTCGVLANFQGCMDEGFIPFKGKCYFISISQWLKIRNADNTCKARGANLVGIETKEEFDFIVDEIERRIGFLDDDPFRYSSWWRKQFWTSGRRDVGLTGWRWNKSRVPLINTTPPSPIRTWMPLTFTAWMQDEPSRVYEKGITVVYSRGKWGWNDYVITFHLSFICERKLTSVRDSCPGDFRRFRTSCYLFVTDQDRSQERAKHFCNEHAAHLIAINDEEEFEFACKTIEDIRRMEGSRLEYEEWWTGGWQYDKNNTDRPDVYIMYFQWDTTIPDLILRPWFHLRPRGRVNDAYLALYYKDGKWWWFDENRTSNLDFSCEKGKKVELVDDVVSEVCPNGWSSYRESCYFFSVHSALNRQKAEQKCMEMDARLVAVETDEELKYVTKQMEGVQHYEGIKWWTGGIPLNKQWVWSKDYSQFKDNPDQFLGWALGEPNNWDDQENFITLLYDKNLLTWGLNDVPNNDHISLPFICEKDRPDNNGVQCPSKIGRTKLTKLPVTGNTWATLMLDNTFQCNGHIKIWRYYRGNPNGTAFAGVWRKITDHRYRLVKKTTFQPDAVGRKTIILRHPIAVAAGDVIGVHYYRQAPGGVITSASEEDDAVAENELYTTLSADIYNEDLSDGMIIDFNQYNPRVGKRTYSLFAKLMRSN